MIPRRALQTVADRLSEFPAVALLGPRQVGKTTLALALGEALAQERQALYLDLEDPADREKLTDPALYLAGHPESLVILDEVHRVPELFQVLRGIIDRDRRRGATTGRFLLLGSASIELLKQSGESLAGRLAYVELGPLDVLEVGAANAEALWRRGGFPESFLAPSEAASVRWRANFIRTYLERDVPALGPRIPAETLRRFWTMLAHAQGQLWNASQFARSLGVDAKTVGRYCDLLVDLLLLRRLQPFHRNLGKRLVRSPKVFVRDSGLVHTLLRLDDGDALAGHPVVGPSWEGFAIESLLRAAPERTEASFFRTASGNEADLVLSLPNREVWAVEVKRSLTPRVEPGFHRAIEDIQPTRAFVVYAGTERYARSETIEALPLADLAAELAGL